MKKTYKEVITAYGDDYLIKYMITNYLSNTTPLKDILKELSISKTTFYTLVKKYNLKKNIKTYEEKLLDRLKLKNLSELKNLFLTMYKAKNMTISELAKYFEIHTDKVNYFLKKFKIPKIEKRVINHNTKLARILTQLPFDSEKTLREAIIYWYINENLPVRELSDKLGYSIDKTFKLLNFLNIKKDIKMINQARITLIDKTCMQKYGVPSSFKDKKTREKIKQTNLKKYGADNPSKSPEIRKKIKQTCLEKYGVSDILTSPEVREKIKQTNLKKYGVKSTLKDKNTLAKIKQTCLEKYGVDNPWKASEIRKKIKQLCLEKYGVDNPYKSPEIKKKIKQTHLKKYGVDNPSKSPEIRKKMKHTCCERYGVEYPTQSKEIIEKIHETKLKNGTYSKSEPENKLYYLIYDEINKDVKRQYTEDPRYPHACDFYLENTDCFIELQGDSFRHLREPYNGSNLPEKYIEKSKTSESYKNAIKTYTVSDPLKRMYASLYNLNYLEIWESDYKKGWDWVHFLLQKQGLPLIYKEEVIQREFQNISKQTGNFSRIPTQNKIIEYFQPHFYRKERELWNNPKIREKLVENREKYKFKSKEKITNKQYLQGFKISGIHIGYSFFSPLWIKAFIEKYNVKSIYDPCMGWGHRLLGAKDITYIGNDIDIDTFQGNIKISEYFNMENKTFYNQPAEELIPNESYDAVFTCPPYYDLEIYSGEDTSTSKYKSYDSWLNEWWRKVIQNCLVSSPKYFSFVINNKYKKDMQDICIQEGLTFLEEIPVGKNSKNHFQRVSNNSYKGEYLLIFVNL